MTDDCEGAVGEDLGDPSITSGPLTQGGCVVYKEVPRSVEDGDLTGFYIASHKRCWVNKGDELDSGLVETLVHTNLLSPSLDKYHRYLRKVCGSLESLTFWLLVVFVLLSLEPAGAETCVAGRYFASENLNGINQCADCCPGFYCPGQASDVAFGNDCWGNDEGGDNAPQIECAAGTYTLPGARSLYNA